VRVVILMSVLISYGNVFAATQGTACGDHRYERKWDLQWVDMAKYQVNSTFANVYGTICAGLSHDFKGVKRIVYRDNTGVRVSEKMEVLAQKDVPFLRRSNFPWLARAVMRSTHPLTVSAGKVVVSRENKGDIKTYTLNLKFLRNVKKGFSAVDIRNLPITFSLIPRDYKATISYRGKPFDRVKLRFDGGYNVQGLSFYEGKKEVLYKTATRLDIARRNYR